MNTIQGFQIYSPIGFVHYPCNLANFCKECDTCDVSQGGGYFDKENSDVISFYSRDYVKGIQSLPLAHQFAKLTTYFSLFFSTQNP